MPQKIVMLLSLLVLFVGCEKQETIIAYDAPKDPPPASAPVMPAVQNESAGESHAGHGHEGELGWTAPAEWKSLPVREGDMRFAAYQLSDNPPVQLTVIPLGPESGELLPNVNRWEQQAGLAPSPADKLDSVVKKSTVNGLDVTRVDLTGKDQRTLAAIVPFEKRIWFFKATGPADAVAKQKAAFDAFIGSLKPGEGGHDHADHAGEVAKSMKIAGSKAPDDWKEIPGSKAPRVVGYTVGPEDKKAELVVTRLGANNAGSFLDNVNRWRGQLGLTPVEDVRNIPIKDASAGKEAAVIVEFDQPGDAKSPARRMLVVMASVGSDLWFFKLTGPTDTIEAQRAAFDGFLKSLEFAPEGDAK